MRGEGERLAAAGRFRWPLHTPRPYLLCGIKSHYGNRLKVVFLRRLNKQDMARAIPYDFRLKIIQRKQSGDDNQAIASDFGISESGVKKIWRQYLQQGDEALHTKFANCGRASPYGEEMRTKVSDIRDNDQGAGYVYSKLKGEMPDQPVPSIRTLQRWWSASGAGRPKGRPARGEKKDGAKKPTIPGR
jgi:transposase-like protein